MTPSVLWYLVPMLLLVLQGCEARATDWLRIKRQAFELGHQDPDTCTPPTGGTGRCVSVHLCPQIFAILSTRPIPAHQFAFLRRSICRRDHNGRPMFCCSRKSEGNVVFNPVQPTTAPPTTTSLPTPAPTLPPTPQPTTTSTPPPTDPPTAPPTLPPTAPLTQPPTPPPTAPPIQPPTDLPTPPPIDAMENNIGTDPFLLSTTPNTIEETTMVVVGGDSAATVGETGAVVGGTTVDHAGPAIMPRIGECGNTDAVLPRIVGGRNVNKHDWPWMAALGYEDGRGDISFSCGAALITKRHVLTAAHCVKGQPSLRVVRLGEHDLSTDTEVKHEDYPIRKKIVHEQYNENFQNDIAILELSIDVVFRKQLISPVCLPQPEFFSNRSLVATQPFVAGWGSIEYNERSSDILRDVSVPVIDTESCARSYERFKTVVVDHRTLCAGYADGGKDACQGDSGGPLVSPSSYDNRSKFFLIGVVSLGFRCAEAGYPGIYTRVTHFIPWIYDNLV